jgi:hypothetical protein
VDEPVAVVPATSLTERSERLYEVVAMSVVAAG